MSKNSPTEFSLIRGIRETARGKPLGLKVGIGDDCAVLDPSFAGRLVVTSDLLVEDVDFVEGWISPWLLAQKSVRANLSDIAAMGATPHSCLLGVGLPGRYGPGFLERFVGEFSREADVSGMPLIGGDLSRSERLFVSVTAFGYVSEGDPLLRSGARPGDALFLLGQVGLARAGLDFLRAFSGISLQQVESGDDLDSVFPDADRRACLRAHFVPAVPIVQAGWLQRRGLATAMIDVSDGLVADLAHVLEESGVAAVLDGPSIPPVPGITRRSVSLDYALNGGEDFALLFCASEEQSHKLREAYPMAWPAPTQIGRLIEGAGEIVLVEGGVERKLQAKGFDHFRCDT